MLCASFPAKMPTFYFGQKSWLIVAGGHFCPKFDKISFQLWGGDEGGANVVALHGEC